MTLPNVNPPVIDAEETVESYVRRLISYLTTGNPAEMLTALEAYTHHILPRSEEPAIALLYPEWLEAMRAALYRDIPIKDRLLVFDCLTHNIPQQDALPIALEFVGDINDSELLETCKKILNVQD